MSDFITVLRDTCPVPVLDATVEADRRRSAYRQPQRIRLGGRQQADGHLDLHAGQVGGELRTLGVLPLPRRLLHHTPEGEQPVHLRAGDVFVIEPGLRGTWEVGGDGAQVLRLA